MPFVRGQSGNPAGGRSPGRRYERAIRKAISPERAVAIAEALETAALKGDVDAARVLFDRIMGKARERVDVNIQHTLSGMSHDEIRARLLAEYERRGIVLTARVLPEPAP